MHITPAGWEAYAVDADPARGRAAPAHPGAPTLGRLDIHDPVTLLTDRTADLTLTVYSVSA